MILGGGGEVFRAKSVVHKCVYAGYYDDIDEKRESVLKGIANGVYRGGPIMLKGTTIATTLKTILNFYKTNHSTEQEPLHSDHLDNLINHCLAQQVHFVVYYIRKNFKSRVEESSQKQ